MADQDQSIPDEITHDPSSSRYDIFECRDCDNVVLALGRDDTPMSWNGDPMERVTAVEMGVRPPDVRQVLLNAFGLPKAGLDICLCVIGEGPLSANDVADTLGYDRSTITRYLNKLVDIGLLRRSELNREGGGVVKAYHSVDLDRMRHEILVGFMIWAGEAATLIEEANLTKQDYFDENPDQSLPDIFWDRFPE